MGGRKRVTFADPFEDDADAAASDDLLLPGFVASSDGDEEENNGESASRKWRRLSVPLSIERRIGSSNSGENSRCASKETNYQRTVKVAR